MGLIHLEYRVSWQLQAARKHLPGDGVHEFDKAKVFTKHYCVLRLVKYRNCVNALPQLQVLVGPRSILIQTRCEKVPIIATKIKLV